MSKSFILDNETGEIRLETDSQDLIVKGGPSVGANAAGGGVQVLAQAGNGEGAGGAVQITGGVSGPALPNNTGGAITLTGGVGGANADGGDGGAVNIYGGDGGDGTNSGDGGDILIQSGNMGSGTNAGRSGDITISAGPQSGGVPGQAADGSGSGGALYLLGGGGGGPSGGSGGGVTIWAGSTASDTGPAGSILMKAGSAFGTGLPSDAGSIDIVAGGAVDSNGGNITLLAGEAGGTGSTKVGGAINITAGASPNSTGGVVNISGGRGRGEGGGNVTIRGGAGSTNGQAAGGRVYIYGGQGTGGGGGSGGGSVFIEAGSVNSPDSGTGGALTLEAGSGNRNPGGAIGITAGDGTSGHGGAITVQAGNATGQGKNGGLISITAGDGSLAGGAVSITAGNTEGDAAGDMTLRAGDFTEVNASAVAGDVRIRSGIFSPSSGGSYDGGAGNASITLIGATGRANSEPQTGGAVTIYAGDGSLAGGAVTIAAGRAGASGGANSAGDVDISAGASTNDDGGSITLQAGASTAGGVNHAGGDVNLYAGFAPAENSNDGGNIRVWAGNSSNNGAGGFVSIRSGASDGDQISGNIDIITGAVATGTTSPGDAVAKGGDLNITIGGRDGEPAATHGDINFYKSVADSGYELGFNFFDDTDTYRMRFGVGDGWHAQTADVDFKLPIFSGLGGQFLATDGLGNLGWGNPTSVNAAGGGQIQSDGSYAPEGGAGLGIGQTWTGSDLNGVTRFANVTYTNNSSCPIAVAITFTTNDDTNSSIIVNGAEVAKWDVEDIGSPYIKTLYAIVPAGQSYMGYVRGSTITRWTEMTTTGSCASPGGLGVNQIWSGQSRSLTTAYTNNSGYPIAVSILLGVANGATAALRVTNSGAPGAGDDVDLFNASTIGSNASDNWITLFGIVPNGGQYDVNITGSVIIRSWFELRGPTPLNGGGLGVGQTWSADLGPSGTATRAANTAYENTDSCPRHIQVRTSGIGSTVVESGASAGTLTEVSRQDPGGVTVDNTSVIVTIPAGRFYRITTANTVTRWKELAGGTCLAAALTKIIDADLDTFVRVAETATGDQDRVDVRVGDNSGDFDVSSDVVQISTAGMTVSLPDATGNNEDGGGITLQGGDADGTGVGGAIFLQPGYGSTAPTIPVGSGIPEPTEVWFVDGQGTPQYVGFKAPDDISAASTGDGVNTVWALPEGEAAQDGNVLVSDAAGALRWERMAYRYNSGSGYTGVVEDHDATHPAAAVFAPGAGVPGSYWTFWNANDVGFWHVWFNVTNLGGGNIDPAPPGTLGGIVVPVLSTDLAPAVAAAAIAAINGIGAWNVDVVAVPGPGAADVTITNVNPGPSTDPADGVIPSTVTFVTNQNGQEHQINHGLGQWVTYTAFDRTSGARVGAFVNEVASAAGGGTLTLTPSALQDIVVMISGTPNLPDNT